MTSMKAPHSTKGTGHDSPPISDAFQLTFDHTTALEFDATQALYTALFFCLKTVSENLRNHNFISFTYSCFYDF